MKRLITAATLLLLSTFAIGQKMVIGLELEYTVTGAQVGTSILYESKKQWALGAFYQSAITTPDDRSEKSWFYGSQIQFPFVKSDRISLFDSLRAGLVSNNFFVVVPGLETRVNLGKQFGVSFIMSARKAYPAVAAKLIVKLF